MPLRSSGGAEGLLGGRPGPRLLASAGILFVGVAILIQCVIYK